MLYLSIRRTFRGLTRVPPTWKIAHPYQSHFWYFPRSGRVVMLLWGDEAARMWRIWRNRRAR